jgi:DNA polymerase
LKIIAEQKSPELSDLSDRLVFGEGDPAARLMVIGEAPGADEDEQGEPFVGRAGQLLDQALGSVGIDRDSIWLTNIVKFRPPGNRNPTQAEIKASEPILLEEIRLVNPQIIAPLGNVPSQFLLGTKEGITKLQGKWFEWQGIRVFPLFHPAYLLRNPSRTQGSPKWLMWQALKELRETLDSLGPKQNGLSVSGATQEGLF